MSTTEIFSTHVGMNRLENAISFYAENILHACGDEPLAILREIVVRFIFSTHVGMNRKRMSDYQTKRNILHACGDEPHPGSSMPSKTAYSPRMWG